MKKPKPLSVLETPARRVYFELDGGKRTAIYQLVKIIKKRRKSIARPN